MELILEIDGVKYTVSYLYTPEKKQKITNLRVKDSEGNDAPCIVVRKIIVDHKDRLLPITKEKLFKEEHEDY